MNFRRIVKGPIFWIVLAIAAVLIGSSLLSGVGGPENVDTGVAVADIQAGKVDTATLIDRDQVLELTLKDGSQIRTSYITGQGVNLQELLQEKADAGQLPGGYNVVVPTESLLVTLLVSLLPIILIVFLLFFFMGQMQGGGNKIMSFGKSKAKLLTERQGRVTFDDVAGIDEAREELQEKIDRLKLSKEARAKASIKPATVKALPAPKDALSKELRTHINRTAHQIALKQYDTIHAILTDCALDNARFGCSLAGIPISVRAVIIAVMIMIRL